MHCLQFNIHNKRRQYHSVLPLTCKNNLKNRFQTFFRFAPNASIWLLMTPNGFPSTTRTQKHLLEALMHPRDTSIFFWQNRFLGLKMNFSSLKALRAWKTHFWAKFKGQNVFPDFVSRLTKLGGASIGPNEKICLSDFWLNTYFLEKSIFYILMLKNPAKS